MCDPPLYNVDEKYIFTSRPLGLPRPTTTSTSSVLVWGAPFRHSSSIPIHHIARDHLIEFYLLLSSKLVVHRDGQRLHDPLHQTPEMQENLCRLSRDQLLFVIGQLQMRGAPAYPYGTWKMIDDMPPPSDARLTPFEFVYLPSKKKRANLGIFFWPLGGEKPLPISLCVGMYTGRPIHTEKEAIAEASTSMELEIKRRNMLASCPSVTLTQALDRFPIKGESNEYVFTVRAKGQFKIAYEAKRLEDERTSWVSRINHIDAGDTPNCRFLIAKQGEPILHGRVANEHDVVLQIVHKLDGDHDELLTLYDDNMKVE